MIGWMNNRQHANGIPTSPLAARRGEIELRILVDRSSVEVFADDGRRVITDQVFPSPGSDGVRLFAEAGGVKLERLEVRRMAPAT